MRISDWSSDVCSSDLARGAAIVGIPGGIVDHDIVEAFLAREHGGEHDAVVIDARFSAEDRHAVTCGIAREQLLARAAAGHAVDRQSVGGGKGGSVGVDLGGRRTIKKKKK